MNQDRNPNQELSQEHQHILARLQAVSTGAQPLTRDAWEAFEDALSEINPRTDSALLPALHTCFSDALSLRQLMWSLLHCLERFEEEAGLLALVEQTPALQEQAPHWLSILWARVLNNAQARSRLQHEILPLLADEQRAAIRAYLLAEADLEAQARPLFTPQQHGR